MKKILVFTTIAFVFIVSKIFSMSPKVCASTSRCSTPISEWCFKDPLKTKDEKEKYESTWDSSKTLEKNQSNLVEKFLSECCNRPSNITRFGDDFESLAREDLNRVFGIWRSLSKTPMGCKLMRILIAKYHNKSDKKLYFVKALKEEYKLKFRFISCKQLNLMLIPSVWHIKKCHSVRLEEDKFMHFKSDVKEEDAFFHDSLHWLHSVDDEFDLETQTTCLDRFYKTTRSIDTSKLPCALNSADIRNIFAKFIYENDEELRTMFGIIGNSENWKFDPLNEAAYMYNRYGWIRTSHIFKLATIGDCRSETENVIGALIAQYGDKELWDYYLRGNCKIPKFGCGQYKCSDLDSMTGFPK